MLLVPEEYDPAWATRFDELQAALKDATGIEAEHIQHIGSTAVEGLWAKPIIDIQIGVVDLAAFDLSTVAGAGFSPVTEITRDDPFRDGTGSETDWQKKYARCELDGKRIAHLHIRQIGNANHRFALLFRDFLRSDPETCRLYSEFKISVARLTAGESDQGGTVSYLDLKDPFVSLIACRAEDWATTTGWIAPD
ncbi:MAG: GrpB family protein [Pseudomonadota bacterium]